MAYSRYSNECNWYIFWERSTNTTPSCKEDERLAVWHVDHRKESPSFTFVEVKEMLSQRDYMRIPGYDSGSRVLLEGAFQQFIANVTSEYES
jgi:hypothetical protein